MGTHEPYSANNQDSTLNITRKMDAQQRIQDVAKKLCLHNGELWEPSIDENKPGGLTDEERKQLTLEQETIKLNHEEYLSHVEQMFSELSSIGYTITTK